MTTTADRRPGEVVADEVVLLDESGRPCGTAPRETIHSADTPLHLAFSCYLVDSSGHVLMTRRALTKRSWPGVWTNAFCGHPRPDEDLVDAARRHARHELGITLDRADVVLADFRYRARDAHGVVENEICPVLIAATSDPIRPAPSEVAEYTWVTPADLAHLVAAAPWAVSPWSAAQVPLLAGLIGGPS